MCVMKASERDNIRPNTNYKYFVCPNKGYGIMHNGGM